MDENLIWEVRAFIYQHLASSARAPQVEETAAHFGLSLEDAAFAYQELQRHHAIFLQPGTQEIQMAWPFSNVKTPFRVHANQKTYFANCAWDSFGIPVALHTDAEIEAICAQSGEPLRFNVTNGQVQGPAALVHFLVPFKDWYNDLPST